MERILWSASAQQVELELEGKSGRSCKENTHMEMEKSGLQYGIGATEASSVQDARDTWWTVAHGTVCVEEKVMRLKQ